MESSNNNETSINGEQLEINITEEVTEESSSMPAASGSDNATSHQAEEEKDAFTQNDDVEEEEEKKEKEDDDKDVGVTFQEKVDVAVIPSDVHQYPEPDATDTMASSEKSVEEVDPEEFGLRPTSRDFHMSQLHREGRNKSFKERRFPPNLVVRKLNRVDLEEGEKVWREMVATPIWDFQKPMDPKERKLLTTKAYATGENEDDDDNSRKGVAQYRLNSRKCNRQIIGWLSRDHYLVARFFHWTFRASFIELIIVFFLMFMTVTTIWAGILYAAALSSPRCFTAGGLTLEEWEVKLREEGRFENMRDVFFYKDAFQLSWTTFSTVGYGVVYPTVNKQHPDHPPDCFAFSFFVTLESFVGVLFGAFCGSILFSKIAKIQSVAAIEWSDPMVIRYGMGVIEPKEGDDSDSDSGDDDEDEGGGNEEKNNNKDLQIDSPKSVLSDNSERSKSSKGSKGSNKSKTVRFPCPVLEFRVVNRLNDQRGGEIINASLKVIASTEESKAMESLQLTEGIQKRATIASLARLSKELTQKTGKAIHKTTKRTKQAAHRVSQTAHLSSHHSTSTAASSKKSGGSLVQKMNRAIAKPPTGIAGHMDAVSELSSNADGPEPEPFNLAEEQQKQEELTRRLALVSLAHAAASTKHLCCEEGSNLVPRRVFTPVPLVTDTHPWFRRVWNVRHVLDEASPLLSAKAKKIIQKNRGKWPQDICNPEFIRKHVHFHQIIVTLTGQHNNSGSDVFGMHVYNYENLNIGYRLVKMMDVDDLGKLYVDMELINDVKEQRGGGAEAIRGVRVSEFGEVLEENDNQE